MHRQWISEVKSAAVNAIVIPLIVHDIYEHASRSGSHFMLSSTEEYENDRITS